METIITDDNGGYSDDNVLNKVVKAGLNAIFTVASSSVIVSCFKFCLVFGIIKKEYLVKTLKVSGLLQ